MTGGLLQIVNYGTQDYFLTGLPEITFFKIVYRRYTNFSMESINIPFNNQVGFGKLSECTVPKVGDLIHKVYLQITLPAVNLKRKIMSNNILQELNTVNQQYIYLNEFMNINIQAYRVGIEQIDAVNILPIDIILEINNVFSVNNFLSTIKSNFEAILVGTNFLYGKISIQDLLNELKDSSGNILSNVTILDIQKKLKSGLKMSQLVINYFYNKLKTLRDLYNDQTNTNAKTAWIKYLGHYIINYAEISIGGDVIDRQTGEWIHIWNELTKNMWMEDIYNKMIGNIDELITPSRTIKNTYNLYIPIPFWFCRQKGLAIPLVAINYHDINISIKFRNFHECFYVSELSQTELNNNSVRKTRIKENGIIDLQNFVDVTGIDIYATLFVDFIYLDSFERKKFAQSQHEYLIEQVQIYEYNNVTPIPLQLDVQFRHPCKQMIWVVQDVKNITYIDGNNELKFSSYTYNTSDLDLLSSCSLLFNGINRVQLLESSYYNFVQPYQIYNNSPMHGIYLYSFSLYPTEAQPSGSANLSNITKVTLNLQFKEYVQSSLFNIHIYVTSYNVLRVSRGMCNLVFSI